MTVDESDLRELLFRDSRDVAAPEEFRTRLARAASPTRHRPSAGAAVAAAVVVVLLLTTGRLLGWESPGHPAAAVPHTAHLALGAVPQFRVTAAQNLGDREVLQVSYEPDGHASYDGGAVTLYDPGVFRSSAFLPKAVPAGDAYYGSYPYTGDWAPVTTLAWPLRGGRWVSVQNFRGTEYEDAPTIRTLEVRVAAAVIIR